MYLLPHQIRSQEHVWEWCENVLLPNLYPGSWHDDGVDFNGKTFISDANSKIVNGVRLRQIRVRPGMCML